MSQDKRGQVVTFYSYKGGTGCSMAVANVACLLAKKGQKVLVIDWDLEASTQHYPFADLVKTRFQGSSDPAEDFRMHPGLLELLEGLKRFVAAAQPFAGGDPEDSASAVAHKVDLARFIISTDIEGLSLMKAGRFDKDFNNRAMSFDWEEFYDSCPSLLTALAWRLGREYDWVLIDTTSGIGDAASVCTSIMPEKIVFLSSPSGLNLEGGIRQLKAAGEYRRNSSDLRPLLILPVLSRGVLQGEEPHTRWRDANQAKFEALFKDLYALPECNLAPYMEQCEIPEVVDAPNSDEVVVVAQSADSHSSLVTAYTRFVEHLTSGKLPWGQ